MSYNSRKKIYQELEILRKITIPDENNNKKLEKKNDFNLN